MLTLSTVKKDVRVKAEFERLGRLSRAGLLNESDIQLRALYGTASNARDHRLSASEIWDLTDNGRLEYLGQGSSVTAYKFSDKAVVLRNNGYTGYGNQLFNRMRRYEKMINRESEYLKYFLPIYRAGMKAGDKMSGKETDKRYVKESFLIVPYCEIYNNTESLLKAAEKHNILNPSDRLHRLENILHTQILSDEPPFLDFHTGNIGIYQNPLNLQFEIVVSDYGAEF